MAMVKLKDGLLSIEGLTVGYGKTSGTGKTKQYIYRTIPVTYLGEPCKIKISFYAPLSDASETVNLDE